MAGLSATLALAVNSSPSPTIHETLSGIFGSVSLTAWICLLLPQVITNYKVKSADGLSMGFLFLWLLGDVTNLAGSLLTNLAPTAIALAVYFCFSDLLLIAQCSYYNFINARRQHRHLLRHSSTESDSTVVDAEEEQSGQSTEDEPLLSSLRRRGSSINDAAGALPRSLRRHSLRHEESGLEPLRRIVTGENDDPDSNPWLHNTLSLLAVWIVGTAGWLVSVKMGAWDDGAGHAGGDPETIAAGTAEMAGMVLGYISTLSYLAARIPQIVKNWREKSTEGLAILFFLLSLTGNFTYGATLATYLSSWSDFIKYIPWLLGSIGTMVEDLIIFAQFRAYSPQRQAKNNNVA